nr:pre-mRNA-splicing factor CWC22 homolog [Tanacetum cinerariifolium]
EDKWGGLFHALRNSLEISKYAPSTSRAVTSMLRLDISTGMMLRIQHVLLLDNEIAFNDFAVLIHKQGAMIGPVGWQIGQMMAAQMSKMMAAQMSKMMAKMQNGSPGANFPNDASCPMCQNGDPKSINLKEMSDGTYANRVNAFLATGVLTLDGDTELLEKNMFPDVGHLLLRRVVFLFDLAYKRNDKHQSLATTKFIAHLLSQQVVHELLALELLVMLLENPTVDSVEVTLSFVTKCGSMLQGVCSCGLDGIFDHFRDILCEGETDKRHIGKQLYLTTLECKKTVYQHKVEAVIHFEDDNEELQQWDQQIFGLCQSFNDVLDSMAKKGLAILV